ncbi:hypothetical protein ABZW18_07695 [Streptomyces sp. NPDC004647]|uniref:hypothetical protein n=1 Tax=Streptomyces sp. NPDC004647 TaxID=3154671 RepID=UPI0033B6D8BC
MDDHPSCRQRRRLLMAPVLVMVSALLVSGCGGGAGPKEKRSVAERKSAISRETVKVARPASVEKLASTVGCTAEITTEVDDYRQGVCHAAKAQYLFVSFDTDKGKRDWLEYAQMYGGVYLVGNRWVISAKPEERMKAAQKKLGGTIDKGEAIGASSSGSSGSSSGSSSAPKNSP